MASKRDEALKMSARAGMNLRLSSWLFLHILTHMPTELDVTFQIKVNSPIVENLFFKSQS